MLPKDVVRQELVLIQVHTDLNIAGRGLFAKFLLHAFDVHTRHFCAFLKAALSASGALLPFPIPNPAMPLRLPITIRALYETHAQTNKYVILMRVIVYLWLTMMPPGITFCVWSVFTMTADHIRPWASSMLKSPS
jgi:hypothetical protein